MENMEATVLAVSQLTSTMATHISLLSMSLGVSPGLSAAGMVLRELSEDDTDSSDGVSEL